MHPTFLPRLRRSITSTGFLQNPLRRSLLSRRRGKADRSWGVPRTQRINSSRHASYQQDLRGRCRLPWTIICSGWRCSACTFLHPLQISRLNNIHAMHFFTNMYEARRQGIPTYLECLWWASWHNSFSKVYKHSYLFLPKSFWGQAIPRFVYR